MTQLVRYGTKRYGVGPYVRTALFEQAPNVVGDWTKQIDTTQEIWSKQKDYSIETWLDLTNRN